MTLNDFANYAVIFTSFSVFVGVLQYIATARTRHNDFEMMYINRLWEVLDNISAAKISKNDSLYEEACISYLILSNDQVELRSLGRVGNKTWSYWSKDIYKYCSKNDHFKQIIISDPITYASLASLLRYGENYDPLGKSWRRFLLF